jgi:hypothetical protein
MCSCAPGNLQVNLFSICREITLDLLKICNFQLVSQVVQKVFDLESWNITGMLLSMWNCVPLVLVVGLFCFVRVIALELVKVCHFQIDLHIALKVFDLKSWNFTGMLLSMWRCAPGVSLVDLFCFVRVTVLELVEILSLCHSSKSIWLRVMKLYRNDAQHVKLCTWCITCWFIQFCQSYCLWISKKFHF